MDRDEVFSILTNASIGLEDGEESTESVTYSLALGSKIKRRDYIKSETESLQKLVSAAIEISRIWRGFVCRKAIKKAFVQYMDDGDDDDDGGDEGNSQAEKQRSESEASELTISKDKPLKQVTAMSPTIHEGNEEVSDEQAKSEEEVVSSTSEEKSKVLDKRANPTKENIKSHSTRGSRVSEFKKLPGMTKSRAATIIQRSWRRHIDMQVFRYYRDMINFRGQGDPSLMLRCINPSEAKLLDAAAGVHVRFRLAGEKFPPNIYYKIYTHRPIIDICANSPKDYTKPGAKLVTAIQANNNNFPLYGYREKDGWYARYENNGWRLVSDRLVYESMDVVTVESSKKTYNFHHLKLKRRADVEHRRRKRKIDWMKKMYKEGLLQARDDDQDTKELVDKAARGLVNTVNMQGHEVVMDWEVDELLQWTTALNFDDYVEAWKDSATSNISDVINTRHAKHLNAGDHSGGAAPVDFDPFSITRASSSIDARKSLQRGIPSDSLTIENKRDLSNDVIHSAQLN